jgi:hypothetical protein
LLWYDIPFLLLSTPTHRVLATVTSSVYARYGPGGQYGGGNHGGGGDNNNNNYGSYGGGQGQRGGPSQAYINSRSKVLIAHGVLAALAFVIFFPVGAILIRLGSFRGVWLVHGITQLFAYVTYIVAFGLGIWMVRDFPVDLLDSYHPIIGITVFVLLFFQPILGYIHHLQFKKYSRRTVWSYGHLWLGRVVVTLGIINGGLGMLLASNAPAFLSFRPSKGQIVAYGVVAGNVWLLWVATAIVGEQRRSRALARKAVENGSPLPSKERYAYVST